MLNNRASIVSLAAILLLCGCLGKEKTEADRSSQAALAPQRIISTSPGLTEILFAIGAGDRIVGVSEFCTYPPETASIQKIGGIVNASMETIVALQPDLVILGSLTVKLEANLRNTDIRTLHVDEHSIEKILQNIRKIGAAVGLSESANKLATDLERQMRTVQVDVGTRKRKRVLFVVGRSPGTLNDIYVVGSGVFLSDLIEMAGGQNVFADLSLQYAKVTKEDILARRPEIIVESAHNIELTDKKIDEMSNIWGQLSSLPAVQNRQIYILNDDYLLIPGPRFINTLHKLKAILHPEPGQ